MLTHILRAAALMGVVAMANAQSTPVIPDSLKAPAGEKSVLQVHASGFQIYTCQAGADGKLSWTLKAPDAELRDSQGVIGHHSAGPTWQHNDGSLVTGKMVARADSPDKSAIPWLLLTATGHSGDGILNRVTTIQRINTVGGLPPSSGCDESHRGAETKSKYTADYYFYAPAE